MEFSGLALWAENESERPQWVHGTWRVDGGVIRRVGDEETAPSVGFIVPGMVDTHCHIGYSATGTRQRVRCPNPRWRSKHEQRLRAA